MSHTTHIQKTSHLVLSYFEVPLPASRFVPSNSRVKMFAGWAPLTFSLSRTLSFSLVFFQLLCTFSFFWCSRSISPILSCVFFSILLFSHHFRISFPHSTLPSLSRSVSSFSSASKLISAPRAPSIFIVFIRHCIFPSLESHLTAHFRSSLALSLSLSHAVSTADHFSFICCLCVLCDSEVVRCRQKV